MPKLSAAQAKNFHRDGFLIWPGIFSPELMQLIIEKAEVLRASNFEHERDNMRLRFMPFKDSENSYLEAIDPISDLVPEVDDLIHHPDLQQAISLIYGEQAHCLKDKFLFKPPHGTGYSLHQDYISWPDFPKSCIIALIALDKSGQQEGGLEVFPRWHNKGYLGPYNGDYHAIPPHQVEEETALFIELNPGDVLLFSCMLPHRSGINNTAQERRHLYLSYNSESDGGNQRDRYYKTFEQWFKEKYNPNAYFK